MLFVLLILVPIIGLLGLLWLRFAGKGKQLAAVATDNHPSVVRRHYGPAPVLAPQVAAPPLAAGNPLSQLMPEEDFRAQAEKDNQAEADRLEAEEAELRQAAEAAADQPDRPKAAAPVTGESSPISTAAPAPGSAPPAVGTAVSVVDALGVDEPAPVAAKSLPPAATAPEDDTVAESLFYNPFSVPAPTNNDKANRSAAAELRRRTREAIKAETADNRTALTNLLAKNNAPR
ncbi:hypothetical protein [Hymenobacter sp. BT559]|uniref:hypothetical protein n=1 Tax=Hymenobacter sp. BT559 TaxID=2795729 RepID=UPI001A1A5169|nr:hypothetical protein [Hymenobacter sp. BT559]MBJ6146330.1 hypothetical protein [Hymenobacter sp. BT559]